MDKEKFSNCKKFWKEFSLWENSRVGDKKEGRANIAIIGEMVDFYLKKYPSKKSVISEKDYLGITRLHKKLSLWRKKYAH
ncbi:MAG: hypothetical protein ABH836_00460 [Candidatus Omnitrophota bacterium]